MFPDAVPVWFIRITAALAAGLLFIALRTDQLGIVMLTIIFINNDPTPAPGDRREQQQRKE
jgi:hypothetical protein